MIEKYEKMNVQHTVRSQCECIRCDFCCNHVASVAVIVQRHSILEAQVQGQPGVRAINSIGASYDVISESV